ncbi:heparan-alpha-glucosaminide N-acetyltransferase-like [Mya arenaria]|uniref:heparan-alpha-glucosaminide N-acetyltransferase-like n=1 Tax=Mya arenaria TaxID=6604 RepID=UPI0022E58DE1|nr:heparan-alpha-glucosaminide N-acetyltransferase-like [Mya arenaria]
MKTYLNIWIFMFCLVLNSGKCLRGLTTEEREYVERFNSYHGNNKPDLIMDEAWMTFNSTVTFDLLLYMHNHECWKCDLIYIHTIPGGSSTSMKLNTTYGTTFEIRRNVLMQDTETIICGFSEKFRENGDYWLFFNQTNFETTTCDFSIANDPAAAEMPILYVAIGVLVLGIAVKIVVYIYRRQVSIRKKYDLGIDSTSSVNTNDLAMTVPGDPTSQEDVPNTHSKRQRLHSLDTFRGLSLLIMIFVNYGGGGYWFFDHPPWNGLTIADLVFPWFVFIMGVSMNYSFRGMLKRGKTRLRILGKVLKRAALLFAFGIILNTNWGPVDMKKLRIPGVLQRLSLSYLIVALMETAFAALHDRGQAGRFKWLRDVVYLLPEWIISLCILATYLALTFAMPVPGCPTGYIGPGGLHAGKAYQNCTGGAAGYIDRVVLGHNHIYGNPTPKAIYQTVVPYDPEGILGTLASIFLCFLGLQGGRIFVTYKGHKSRIIRLIVWSLITGAIGAALCNVSKNDGIIPLNKNLWSVSFVLVTACFGYFLLAALYVVIDVFQVWAGEPFIFAGMNPLVLYLCHDIFYRFFPVNFQVDPVHWRLLLKAVWDVLIWLTLGFVLYCKKIFIAL